MAYAEVNGARLAWQQLGEGPDLILVHGLATNRAFWFEMATQLQDRWRVTLFDLRGHGYSSRPASGYRSLDFAQDLLGLMDRLGIARAALVGHSYGGAAALEAAGLAPERVSHLGLLDARIARLQPLMRLHDTPRISDVEREIATTQDVDWEKLPQVGYLFLETAARLRLAGGRISARDDFAPFGEGRGAARAAQAWLDLLDQTTARDQLDEPGMSADALSALRLPVLLMYGEHSRCVHSGHALRALWPHARYVELAQAGHFFPRSQPQAVLQELRRLLEMQL
ncbi:MAG: alpha/beta hydrolase [Sinimarinibacterium sp.]|jgi:pimeloyl-ACP methyl ester carboxylesterase